ncbi:hypothetical protein [Sphaerospermopsis torques-reginae]|uniref:Transmembrane protein n=1 Tax=Sphaerospermopsis torques-reginae ITEP-024 TaxID=984208 RepID=A0ABX8WZX8_9CYAN|nr:hypothetical protein [Sphaerospermopsis torques-reginae]QYX31962.1 hypothetical protein K2F26_00495 [Sphaerospermopsis torques-reginae ITEP-024]
MNIHKPHLRQFTIRQSFTRSLIGGFVWLGIASSIPLIGAFLVGNGDRLICQREKSSEGKCEFIRERFLDHTRVAFPLSALTTKVTRSVKPDDEGKYCYFPTIVVQETFSTAILTSCSEEDANWVVSEINQFISTSTEQKLDLHPLDWRHILLGGSPFILFGLLSAALIIRNSLSISVFDLDRKCLTITRKKWFRTTQIEEYDLDIIAAVNLETHDNGMSIEEQIIIKLESDQKIILPYNDYNNKKLVSDLQQFLNLR